MADHLHRCFILTLVHINCSTNHLIAKSCSAMQTFPSVSTVYDSPCMTWTVYWTLILCRLPTLIQPALLSDYSECLPPALILSLNSDSDSALPTLCLKPVIELYLFDLHSVLIKLHMDPNAIDSSLQLYIYRHLLISDNITTQNCADFRYGFCDIKIYKKYATTGLIFLQI